MTGSVVIGVQGLSVGSGWSVDTVTGLLTFSVAPAAGQAITAGYLFDVPVRFDTDTLSLTVENYALEKADIPLMELRG